MYLGSWRRIETDSDNLEVSTSYQPLQTEEEEFVAIQEIGKRLWLMIAASEAG